MVAQADRLQKALRSAIESALPRQIDYMAYYRARVVAQSGTHLLDLIPDNADLLPPMSKIEFRHGEPGIEFDVGEGAFVFIGWEGGNPTRPYCFLPEGGAAVARYQVNADAVNLAGTSFSPRVARMGDAVEVTIPAGTVIPGVGTVGPPGLTVTGTITGGSTKVRAG